MKQLLLIRHAKSSWDDLSGSDFDRQLSGRGLRDAPIMGRRLAERGLFPDAFLISSAQRTRTTAKLLAGELNFPEADIDQRDALYLASPATMLQLIRQTPEYVQRLALVAHNPGITELTNQLANTDINNIPTCGVALLDLGIDSWRDAGRDARLVDFDYPKRQQL